MRTEARVGGHFICSPALSYLHALAPWQAGATFKHLLSEPTPLLPCQWQKHPCPHTMVVRMADSFHRASMM